MTVTDIIKAKTLGLNLSDSEIALAREEVEVVFKNYCNRYDIPTEARFLIANLAVDVLKARHEGDGNGSDIPSGELASMTVDDVSLSFDSSRRTHVVNLDDIVLNYREQLNTFRQMRW